MSDATEPRPSTPFPAEIDSAAAQVDPLAGDWSAGLRGAARALGIPEPKLLPIEHVAPPPPLPLPAPVPAPVAETVEAPDAWAAAREDPLQSQPPPVQQPLLLPDTTPPSPAPAFLPDITPTSPAPAFLPESAPAAVEAEKTPPDATRAPEPTFEADKTPPMPTRIPEELRPDTAPPAVEVRSAAEEPLRKAPEIGGAPLGESSPEALPSVIVAPLAGKAPTPWSEAVPATQGWGDTPQAATPAAAEESGWGGVSTSAATVISPVPSDPAPGWEAPPAAAVDPWSMPPPAAPVPDAWSAPPAPAAPV
ncbi:MAG TPA: hypothetical protein VF993_06730, partial [Myxococcales bacterium]